MLEVVQRQDSAQSQSSHYLLQDGKASIGSDFRVELDCELREVSDRVDLVASDDGGLRIVDIGHL